MAVILFVDLLGARKKWQISGVDGATDAFNKFARLVVSSLKEGNPGDVLTGGIETDAAILVFGSAFAALSMAKRLFLRAFNSGDSPRSPRLWLRGSLVATDSIEFIRRQSQIKKPFDVVNIFTYSAPALDAISIEKSGFKGMRLLVRADVIDKQTRELLCMKFGPRSLIPVRRLKHSSYPAVANDGLQDFLWMAAADEGEWSELALHMTSRLRFSAKDPEEFAQAAATQVVFHEFGAIRQAVIYSSKRT